MIVLGISITFPYFLLRQLSLLGNRVFLHLNDILGIILRLIIVLQVVYCATFGSKRRTL